MYNTDYTYIIIIISVLSKDEEPTSTIKIRLIRCIGNNISIIEVLIINKLFSYYKFTSNSTIF